MATGDAETGMEELLEAAGLGYADEVVRLCGEHPELPQQDVPDGEGAKTREFGAVHVAARFDQVEAFQALHSLGFDVAARDKHGNTALHYAATFGCERVAAFLTNETKVDPTLRNDVRGRHAHRPGSLRCAHQLTCVDRWGQDGFTALDFAEQTEQGAVADALRKAIGLTMGDPQVETLRQWLDALRCGRYLEEFVRAGFDDLAFIAAHGLEESELVEIGVDRVGHRKKLASLYRIEDFVEKPAAGEKGGAAGGGEEGGGSDDEDEDESEEEDSDEDESDEDESSEESD